MLSLAEIEELVRFCRQPLEAMSQLCDRYDRVLSSPRVVSFERNLIRERTQAGLSAARARGRLGGRPKILHTNKRDLTLHLHRERKHSVNEICTMMVISKSTLYNYLSESDTNDVSSES